MGYLVQKTRAAQLLIGGNDYTSSLVQFSVTDSGAFKKGLVTTSGSITLGQRPGQTDIEDYDRNIFKRGTLVTLDIVEPGGTPYRHPRGYLYVFSCSYDVESEQLEIEVACRLSLAYLTDDASSILPLVPIPLDPAQQTVENCSASFAAAGMVLYQTNQGALASRKFFGNDSSAGIGAGAWVSVLGESAISVAPLSTNGAIPDEIELSYEVPEGIIAGDNLGKVDVVTETSYYFINYPATIWKRNPDPNPTGVIQLPDQVITIPTSPSSPSNCGQTPTPPNAGGTIVQPGGTENFYLCNDLWTTDREAEYLPAVRTAVSTTTYGAVGAQVSYVEQTVEGPEIEANPGYFADWFAYCVSTFGHACNPMGSCPYYGMEKFPLSRTVTYYEYGGYANELIRTIQDNYVTTLSAYIPSDYRSGNNGGVPQGFEQGLSAAMGFYRQSRVITEYSQQDNLNIQLTTSYTSITSRGVGVKSGASLDALAGIKTSVRRESTTTTTLDVRPDSVNTATTSTVGRSTNISLRTNSYTTPPNEAGKYILEEAIPVPLLSPYDSIVNGWVRDYKEYLTRFVKGDLYGLQIAESMRSEIVTGWYPGMPFRYADTANNKIFAMRMDACVWGVTPDEAMVVMNGVWLGFSTGTLNLGSNLVGNSRPDVDNDGTGGNGGGNGGTPTPPLPPAPPPTIDDDLVGESFSFTIDVDLWIDTSMFVYFPDGITKPNPVNQNPLVEQAIVPYVTGFVVETGGVLEIGGDGTIPIEYAGSIVTETAVIVDDDLFS